MPPIERPVSEKRLSAARANAARPAGGPEGKPDQPKTPADIDSYRDHYAVVEDSTASKHRTTEYRRTHH